MTQSITAFVDSFIEQTIARRSDILRRAIELVSKICNDAEHAKRAGDLAKASREAKRLDRLDRAISKVLERHDAASYAALETAIKAAQSTKSKV